MFKTNTKIEHVKYILEELISEVKFVKPDNIDRTNNLNSNSFKNLKYLLK